FVGNLGGPGQVAGRAPVDRRVGFQAGAVATRSAPTGPVLGRGPRQRSDYREAEYETPWGLNHSRLAVAARTVPNWFTRRKVFDVLPRRPFHRPRPRNCLFRSSGKGDCATQARAAFSSTVIQLRARFSI